MEWILTLDQDSVVSRDMISAMVSLAREQNMAIICPQIEDFRRNEGL
jgi:GT2 family glycosyltransferase